MDADNGLGLVIGRRAMDLAIDFAKSYGLGAVAVRNRAISAPPATSPSAPPNTG